MNRNKTTLINIFTIIFCLCIITMSSCAKHDPSVEVLCKKKISGHTLAVCKFSDETIRLTHKTKEGYVPFFTMYETDIKDVSIEQVKIQGGYTALEHDLFRVMFYIKALDEYETAFFYFNEVGNPVGIALCKGQFFLADLDGDGDSEIVNNIRNYESGMETSMGTALVYDWKNENIMVSNVNKCARLVFKLPDEAVVSTSAELPPGYSVGYPDANIFPEFGVIMKFRLQYRLPSEYGEHVGLHLWWSDLVFEPFTFSILNLDDKLNNKPSY